VRGTHEGASADLAGDQPVTGASSRAGLPYLRDVRTAAHQEAGHALAFRSAVWLPEPPPLPVRSVEVAEDTEGRWTGHCIGMNIFSSRSINGIATPAAS
jgi:hypothetical protein